METKFIEGTNQQYSIREDGVVFRHYTFSKDGKRTKIFETIQHKVCPHASKKYLITYIGAKTRKVKNLISDYFEITNTIPLAPRCSTVISHKDGDINNCSASNLYYTLREGVYFANEHLSLKEKQKLYHKIRYANPETRKKAVERAKIWADKNPEKVKISAEKTRKKRKPVLKQQRKEITRWYVASKLGISVKDLPEKLYLHYKKTLQLKRKVAKKHNIPIGSFNH